MSRVKTTDGVGIVLTQAVISGGTLGTATTIGGVKSVSGGGYSYTMLDDTDQSNENVTTKVPSTLKEYKDISVTLKEKAVVASGNSKFTITFSGATLTFYGIVSDNEPYSGATPGTEATQTVTITVTNLDESGDESEPTLVRS